MCHYCSYYVEVTHNDSGVCFFFSTGTMLIPTVAFWVPNSLLLWADTTGKPSFITRYRIQVDKNNPVGSRPSPCVSLLRCVCLFTVLIPISLFYIAQFFNTYKVILLTFSGTFPASPLINFLKNVRVSPCKNAPGFHQSENREPLHIRYTSD